MIIPLAFTGYFIQVTQVISYCLRSTANNGPSYARTKLK